MADDICDWLAKEEADAEEWGGLGGAQYYRKQFAAARTEIERLRTEFSAVLGDAIAKDAENERLRAALAIAAGMISTMPQYEHQHPESVLNMLLEEARRER